MSTKHPNPRVVALSRSILGALEIVGLVVISAATLIAGGQELLKMVAAQEVNLADLLLLFIYLEVLAMVGVYLESGALPIRMPLYIAMVALARPLILDMKHLGPWDIIATATGMLVIGVAVLVIRYGHMRFPYESSKTEDSGGHPIQ